MFAKPQAEHAWLEQLVGEWITEADCLMPDGQKQVTPGKMSCQMLGGLWLLGEGIVDDPDVGEWESLMQLGYDPAKGAYVGTFVASMMVHLWQYTGTVDKEGKRLALDTEGPTFDDSGLANYQDTIEIVSPDHWVLTSRLQGEDGTWTTIMTSHAKRAA